MRCRILTTEDIIHMMIKKDNVSENCWRNEWVLTDMVIFQPVPRKYLSKLSPKGTVLKMPNGGSVTIQVIGTESFSMNVMFLFEVEHPGSIGVEKTLEGDFNNN